MKNVLPLVLALILLLLNSCTLNRSVTGTTCTIYGADSSGMETYGLWYTEPQPHVTIWAIDGKAATGPYVFKVKVDAGEREVIAQTRDLVNNRWQTFRIVADLKQDRKYKIESAKSGTTLRVKDVSTGEETELEVESSAIEGYYSYGWPP